MENLPLYWQNHNWEELESKYDWIQDMKDVRQDPRYHGEIFVGLHTQMVVSHLLGLKEFKNLEFDSEKQILYLAALLHDVEKRSTTVTEDDGSITSKGHSRKGAKTTFIILEDLGYDFDVCYQVSMLVKYHMVPTFVFVNKNSEKDLLELSTNSNLKHLIILSMADNLGRVGLNLPTQLENLELLAEYANEYNCFDNPYKFKSELAKFRYFNIEPNIHYDPYNDRKFNVHLMVGLPGAGKDTIVENELSDLPVVSLDDIRQEMKISATDNQGRVIQAAKEKAKEYMRAGQDFVYNATNITRLIREPLIDLFYSYGGYITIWHVATPIKEIIKQNRQRDAVVPDDVILKLRNKYEIPAVTECHSLFRVNGLKSQ